MASLFANFGQSTGANDGSSWTDAYQTPEAAESGRSATDDLYVKEHSGYARTVTWNIAKGGNIYCGCDSSLTGTDTTPRTGQTVLDGNSSAVRGVSIAGTLTADLNIYQLTVQEFTPTSQRAGVGITAVGSYAVNLTNCVISNNSSTAGWGAGLGVSTSIEINLTDCVIDSNIAAGVGGGIGTSGTTNVTLTGCTISNNSAAYGGGVFTSSVANFVNCKIYGNTATTSHSGGVGGYANLINCLFYNNNAVSQGSAAKLSGGYITGCTFTLHGSSGQTLFLQSGVSIANSIVYNNTPSVGIYAVDSSCVNYCDVEDKGSGGISSGAEGTGCVDVDPQFLGSGGDPYELSSSTPTSVTQGANTGVTGYVDYDILDVDRDNSTPSMGCYEYVSGGAVGEDTLNGITIPVTLCNLEGLTYGVDTLNGLTATVSVCDLEGLSYGVDTLNGLSIPVSVGALEGLTYGVDSLGGITIPVVICDISGGSVGSDVLNGLSIPVSIGNLIALSYGVDVLNGVSVPVSVASIEGLPYHVDTLGGMTIPLSVGSVTGLTYHVDTLSGLSIDVTLCDLSTGTEGEDTLNGFSIPVVVCDLIGRLRTITGSDLERELRELRAEIIQTIMQQAVTRKISERTSRFTVHDAEDMGQPIQDQTGPARLFEVGGPELVSVERTGSTTETKLFRFPITFLYPRGRIDKVSHSSWGDIAAADIDLLRHYFLNNYGGSNVEGVNGRWIDNHAPANVEENMQDNVNYHTVYMMANVDITYT